MLLQSRHILWNNPRVARLQVLLAALCFGTKLDIGAVTAAGIRDLIAADIREAEALGHRVRLIGMAERDETGLYQHVQPCLVPADHPLAYVPGALNAVVAEGNFVGRLFFEGAGAGAGPTASAIVADIIDIARDEYGPAFAMPVDALDAAPIADAGARVGKHYVRLIVEDRIGVVGCVDDDALLVVTDHPDVVVDVERLPVEGERPTGDGVIDPRHRTTTDRSTSPACILSKAASTSPSPISSLTNASRSSRPWR